MPKRINSIDANDIECRFRSGPGDGGARSVCVCDARDVCITYLHFAGSAPTSSYPLTRRGVSSAADFGMKSESAMTTAIVAALQKPY